MKRLLIGRRGYTYTAIRTTEVSHILTQNDVVYIVDIRGHKYIGSYTLNQLEPLLGRNFFRATRGCIVNVEYVVGFKPTENAKLLVEVKSGESCESLQLSQASSSKFKQWIESF
jgi:two-component system, LytTR family, response regulator LytT